MSLLAKIDSKFESSKKSEFKKVEIEKTSNSEFQICEKCSGQKFWRPFHSETWFCFSCKRPSSPVLIQEIREPQQPTQSSDQGSMVTTPWQELVSYGQPACQSCWGRWVIETHRDFEPTEYRCWSCRQLTTLDEILQTSEIVLQAKQQKRSKIH